MENNEQHAEEASKEINVVLEDTSAETQEEVQVEETQTEEAQVAEVNPLQAELDAANARNQELESAANAPDNYNVQELVAQAPAPTPEEAGMDFGDLYADPEGYAKKMETYLKDRDASVTKAAVEGVMNSERMQALEMSHWNSEHEKSVKKAETSFGERFSYGDQHIKAQRQLPGLSIDDAHRVMDYDKLLQEHQNLLSGQKERANVATTASAPTRMVADSSDGKITVKLSAEDRAAADKWSGGDYERYARGKYRQDNK